PLLPGGLRRAGRAHDKRPDRRRAGAVQPGPARGRADHLAAGRRPRPGRAADAPVRRRGPDAPAARPGRAGAGAPVRGHHLGAGPDQVGPERPARARLPARHRPARPARGERRGRVTALARPGRTRLHPAPGRRALTSQQPGPPLRRPAGRGGILAAKRPSSAECRHPDARADPERLSMPVRPCACPDLETAYTSALQQPVRGPRAAAAQKMQILLINDLDGSACSLASHNPETQTVTLVIDTATANAVMFAIAGPACIACNDLTMSVAGHQTLRVLDGSYVLDRPADVADVDLRADVLAVVFGPDGSTVMRRNDAGEDAWSALWN